MPREAMPPRLWFRKPRRPEKGRAAEKGVWLILHQQRQISTGCGKGDRKGAETTLAAYITSRHVIPTKQRHIEQIPIADVLSLYAQDIVPQRASATKAIARISRLIDWWGDKMLDEINGANCRQFCMNKSDGAARRELQDLQAAINHHHSEGLHREKIKITLPEAGEPRQRWLTRSEAAKLLRYCLHFPEFQEGKPTDKRPLRHIARFILFALYTGSRPNDVFTATFYAGNGRSLVDLGAGLFYRKPTGKRATNKKQPTTPLPQRLQAHLRRWHRLGSDYVVEFDGKAIKSIKTGFKTLLTQANISGDVVPYTFRHTFATWKLRAGVSTWEVAGLMGTSEAMIEQHYGHHEANHLRSAAEAGTQNKPKTKGEIIGNKQQQERITNQRKSI